MVPGTRRVYLIDASFCIFRAWFSVPDSLINTARELTGIAISADMKVGVRDVQRSNIRAHPADIA